MTMDDLIQEFLAETTESLDALDIAKLAYTPDDNSLISSLYRLAHTIKGPCGFLGLPRLEAVAQRLEKITEGVREGSLQITAAQGPLIIQAVALIREITSGITATEKEPAGDDAALLARLDAVFESKAAPPVEMTVTEEKPIPALIVAVRGERFAVPLANVRELVRLSADQPEEIQGTPVMYLRNRLLQLISLKSFFKTDDSDTGPSQKQTVIVTEAVGKTFGIIVDRAFNIEEVTVKPSSLTLKGIRLFSGNAGLGDGCVVMVLNPA